MKTNRAPRGILHSSTEDEGSNPVTGAYGSEAEVMLCPWCGSSWSHVDQVDLLSASSGGMRLRADGEDGRSAIVATATDRNGGYRRHTAVLHFNCEQCHGGTINLQQHKGNTFITCEPSYPYAVGDRVCGTDIFGHDAAGVVTHQYGTGDGYVVCVTWDDGSKEKQSGYNFWPEPPEFTAHKTLAERFQ